MTKPSADSVKQLKMNRFRAIWGDVKQYLHLHTREELLVFLRNSHELDLTAATLNSYLTRMRAEDKKNPQPVAVAPISVAQTAVEHGAVLPKKTNQNVHPLVNESDIENEEFTNMQLTEEEYTALVIKRKKDPKTVGIPEVIKMRIYESKKKDAEEKQFIIDLRKSREARNIEIEL